MMPESVRALILDSSPVGVITQPARTPEVIAINRWLVACAVNGHQVILPEIIDYEIRRELLRAGKTEGIARLDILKASTEYLPITTPAMLLAAELWAQSRRTGLPTGDPKKLDVDVILAAQALTLGSIAAGQGQVVVVTSNVAHLSRFVAAELWTNIEP